MQNLDLRVHVVDFVPQERFDQEPVAGDRVDVRFLRAVIDGGFLRQANLALSSEPKKFPIKIGIGVAIGIVIEIGTTR